MAEGPASAPASSARRPAASAGAYVAWHPWLAPVAVAAGQGRLVAKFGHSGRLGDRLSDSAYTTCWGAGWRYLATFEVATKEEAALIEEGCLRFFSEHRIDGRELVCLPTTDVAYFEGVLRAVAKKLEICGALCRNPEYEASPPPPRLPASASAAPVRAKLEAIPILRPGAPLSSPATSSDTASATNGVTGNGGADTPRPLPPPPAAPATSSKARPQPADDDDEDDAEAVLASYALAVEEPPAAAAPVVPRPYQTAAAAACAAELARLGRTTLVMACRCGKTRVAYLVMERYLAPAALPAVPGEGGASLAAAASSLAAAASAPPVVLFLVPWLALVRQTAEKLQAYVAAAAAEARSGGGGVPPGWDFVLVGSGGAAGGSADAMSTDPDALGRRLAARARPTVVVSTYQSSAAACASAAAAGCTFALTVFDECHRVCGGREPRPANFVLLQVPPAATGPRLFMTATPVTRGGGITMAEHALFGGVAYRYHLRRGIDAGYVNDFEIQLVAAGEDADIDSRRAAGAPPTVLGRCRDAFLGLLRLFVSPPSAPPAPGASSPGAVDGATRVLAAQVVLAFDHLRGVPGRNKLLVFCRTIAATRRLAEAIRFLFQQRPGGSGGRGGGGNEGSSEGGPPAAPLVLHASSKTPREELAAALRTFYDPARPVILLNCKLFQEGVEFPPLNGVFFATPRHSSRDIVQSMCRALTQAPGKARSAVYIPVPAAAPPAGGGPPAPLTALGRFETLLPFAEAIYSEDPRFYEHLLDPATPFPLGWLGVHGDGEQLLHAARRAIRYGTRGGARAVDRLTRSDAIPWGVAFGELRRIVHECRRYPKGNDGFAFALARELPAVFGAPGAPKVLNFGTWYDWARREYGRYRAGEASALQPHQARDLESLPEWETRGMGGPYPTQECVETLVRLLEESGGVMPPVNINNGGWIGLDATPLERLSGFLTTVSQQDGRARAAGGTNRGFTLSADKAALLDAAFGKWGLVWRKQRWYPEAELDAVVAEGKAPDRAAAAAWLAANGRPGFLVTGTTKSGKPGDYAGPRTVIQEAHEQFNALARADPRDPFIQKHWPGYPLKHKRMEHDDVWEKGLAPPRHLRGKLISRAPAAKKGAAEVA